MNLWQLIKAARYLFRAVFGAAETPLMITFAIVLGSILGAYFLYWLF